MTRLYEYRALQVERNAEREAARVRYGAENVTWRTEILEYKRLLTTRPLLHRLFLGASVQSLGQWTGISKWSEKAQLLKIVN